MQVSLKKLILGATFSTAMFTSAVILPAIITVGEQSSFAQSAPRDTLNNCVKYARWRVPSLPSGITTYAAKLKIINVKNNVTPAKNYVAIINSGSFYMEKGKKIVTGHVAVVDKVEKGIITISETNWGGGVFRTRTGSWQTLKIDGYFKP